jgi:hypothetical protein
VAQTKKRRRRKHRGTKSGRIDTRPSRGRPRTREEARARARSRKSGSKKRTRQPLDRRDRKPTWGGAVNRALLAAGVFLLAILFLFKRPASEAIPLAALMLLIYVPLGYTIDNFIYNRRRASEQRRREQQQQQKR